MYLDHFQLHSSPFSETLNPDKFFPEAGRGEICKGLLRDIRSGKGFAVLLGNEGYGKTLLCKYLVRRLGGSVEVIFIENSMGSFDDLLRLVCLDLGLGTDLAKDEMVDKLKVRLKERKAQGQHVVLIIDDAEKIFLAALERLLRLLCELQDIGNFTLILAGRPALAANLEQLSVYCSGIDLTHGYELRPFTMDETRRYLMHCLLSAGLNREQHEEIFADQAVEKIYQAARGNPRMTNILAEEALRTSSSEKSFMVLLEHVGGKLDEGRGEGDTGLVNRRMPGWGWKKLLLASLGIILLVAAGFLMLKEGEKPQKSVAAGGSIHAKQNTQQSLKTEQPAVVDERPEKPSPEPDEAKRIAIPPLAEKTVAPPAPSGSRPAQPKQRITTSKKKQKQEISHLAIRDGKALFEERRRASAGWLAGAYKGKYTIQLMMLTSPLARKNMEKLLEQKEYASVLDNLYILQKKTTPPTLFLFYGTYPSMDSARQVRNTMPVFLRKHHPYALSIADALAKTED